MGKHENLTCGKISQHNIETKNAITAENHCFIKDVVEQVVAGDGVGWLKLSRLKKLMEDENYRNLVLSRMNKTLDRRISPDDHIDDVVSFETNNINLNPIPRLRKKNMKVYLLLSELIPFHFQCVKRSVYKGMLKLLLAVLRGLDISLSNFGVGGMASAFQVSSKKAIWYMN